MKKKKHLKIFAAGSLAVLMGTGILCGSLMPINTIYSKTSASEDIPVTPQEQLLDDTLNLDPKNDPVVFTTDYGLEIKSHNEAGLVDVTTNDPSSNGTVTVSSTSWNYISAGGKNWIIIGSYSTSSYTISTIKGDEYSGNNPDATDAGNAIEDANGNGLLKTNVTIPAFSNAKAGYNGEIPYGCVLCLCAGNITTTKFNASESSGNNYSGSNLQSYMNNTVYGSTSTLSSALQSLKIVPQKLTTLYYNSATSTIENAYVFPLAGANNTESFYVGSYLDSSTKRNIGAHWWLRSGYASTSDKAYCVNMDGSVVGSYIFVTNSYGVRPAFVLQLYSA